MVSRNQMAGCMGLDKEGYRTVPMPDGVDTPIPGVILFAKSDHKELLLVLPTGDCVDLLDVYRKAEAAVRNTRAFPPDYGKLTELVEALNGRCAHISLAMR